MKTVSRIALLALAPLLAGSLAYAAGSRPRPAPEPSPAARPVGPAESCVPLSQIRETRIRDDWTIDFVSPVGKRAWRNRLTSRCPGLKSANAITYETSLSQLCSTDIVYVLETTPTPRRGAGCGLGQFVPVELGK